MKREVIGITLIAMAMTASGPGALAQQPHTWTGLYIGANGGYTWGDVDITMTPGGRWSTETVLPQGSRHARENGFTGGIQAGYNYQIGNTVIGVEADVNYLGLDQSRDTGLLTPPLISPYIVSDSFKSHWLATIRPRLGVVAFDQTLLYVTGGLAIGKFEFAQSLSFPTIPAAVSGSVSETRRGWTIGGGLERMAGKWSVKLEYLYVDFGDVGFFTTLPPPVAGVYTQEHEARLTAHIARIGLNYRFN